MDPYRLNYSKEGIERSINQISEHQEYLEEKGWKFIKNVEAKNGLMDYTQDRKSFRLLKEDCRRKFCSGEGITLTRAHDEHGEEIPSEEKIVAIYARHWYGRDR